MPTTPVREVKWGTQEPTKILPRDLSRLRFQVSNGEEHSIANSIKLWVQRLTGESWDWWPLRQSFRPLVQDESRVQWYCVSQVPRCLRVRYAEIRKDSRHEHWTVVPKAGLVLSLAALEKNKAATKSATTAVKKGIPSSERDSSTSTSASRSSRSNSSPATSESGTSDQPNEESGSGKGTDSGTAVDIVPPSNLTGFVIFGVHGSKRLQSACLRLAQIDVVVYNDDDSFFDEMALQYKKLRGFLRRVFSVWVFHTCEFMMV